MLIPLFQTTRRPNCASRFRGLRKKRPNPIRQLANSELLNTESGAVPVLLVRRKPDGTDVVMPGIYVPKSEPVRVDRLAPVERRAIRQVLGIREPLVPKQSI